MAGSPAAGTAQVLPTRPLRGSGYAVPSWDSSISMWSPSHSFICSLINSATGFLVLDGVCSSLFSISGGGDTPSPTSHGTVWESWNLRGALALLAAVRQPLSSFQTHTAAQSDPPRWLCRAWVLAGDHAWPEPSLRVGRGSRLSLARARSLRAHQRLTPRSHHIRACLGETRDRWAVTSENPEWGLRGGGAQRATGAGCPWRQVPEWPVQELLTRWGCEADWPGEAGGQVGPRAPLGPVCRTEGTLTSVSLALCRGACVGLVQQEVELSGQEGGRGVPEAQCAGDDVAGSQLPGLGEGTAVSHLWPCTEQGRALGSSSRRLPARAPWLTTLPPSSPL